MKIWHISNIEELRQQIQSRRDRCITIDKRANAIRHELAYMDNAGLAKASVELADLRRELNNHELYIDWAQKQINEFYRNPIREVAA